MINIALNPQLLEEMRQQIGSGGVAGPPLEAVTGISGGQINRSLVVRQGKRKFFVKLNDATRLEMFAAEREALIELQRQTCLHVPSPVAIGVSSNSAFLVMDYMVFGDPGDAVALGRGVAALHDISADTHGWHRDNTIGTTPQHNPSSTDWPRFWAEHRLGFQLKLAACNGFPELGDHAAELLQEPAVFFAGYIPRPSLLHGDLWCGNFAYLSNGQPTVFDPATYYGDRETDLAMTELFGGFDRGFYEAYRAHAPLDPGYAVRKYYYQLYHVLNHLNLFGAGYLAQANSLIDRLAAEIR